VQPKSTNYEFGTIVQLTALPANGWYFDGWEGDLAGDENPVLIEMDDEKEVTAMFLRQAFALNVNSTGEGSVAKEVVSGTETVDGYLFESVVRLTAEPNNGWEFLRWSGSIQSQSNPIDVEILDHLNITAEFKRIDYTLTLTIEGEGSVEQRVVQPKATEYPFETVVELTAVPETGWEFIEWSGDISGNSNPASITVDEEKSVTVRFERKEFSLNINYQGNGSVSKSLISGTETENGYLFESMIELQAEAGEGWEFFEWTGGLGGSENPAILQMDSDKTVTASFIPFRSEYTVILTLEDNRGSFEMRFGQAENPETLRRLAPPPPPAGALNAYFRYDRTNYVRDFRRDTETSLTWELRYQAGDGSDLELKWSLDTSQIKGNLVLRDSGESFEVNMLEADSVSLPDGDDGVLFIIFSVN